MSVRYRSLVAANSRCDGLTGTNPVVPAKSRFRKLQILQASKFPTTPFCGKFDDKAWVLGVTSGLPTNREHGFRRSPINCGTDSLEPLFSLTEN
jgi:hypothetical protein